MFFNKLFEHSLQSIEAFNIQTLWVSILMTRKWGWGVYSKLLNTTQICCFQRRSFLCLKDSVWIIHRFHQRYKSPNFNNGSISVYWGFLQSRTIFELVESKMRPLKLNQQLMTWIFINSSSETTSLLKRVVYIFLGCAVFASQLAAFAASVAFLIKFLSIDIERSLYTSFQILTSAPAAYMFVVACVSRHKINALFGSLTTICDESNRFRQNVIFLVSDDNEIWFDCR